METLGLTSVRATAAALASAGLADEASAALDRLAREHPGSPLAQRLRREAAATDPAPAGAH